MQAYKLCKLEEKEITPDQHLLEMQDACFYRQKTLHDVFHVPHHLTMRESFIRVLEGNIDPSIMMKDGAYDAGNLSSEDEA